MEGECARRTAVGHDRARDASEREVDREAEADVPEVEIDIGLTPHTAVARRGTHIGDRLAARLWNREGT